MKHIWLLVLILALAGCGKSPVSSEDEGGVQQAERVSIFESKGSQKKWVLDAEEVNFSDLNNAVLTNPVLLLKENGKDSAGVNGKVGTFNYEKRQVTIEGDAEVKSFKEDILITTDQFFYDVDNDRIWSNDRTTVVRGKTRVVARQGIETDSKLERIEFKKQQTRLPDTVDELRVPH